jgi:hypothetical protein
MATRKKARRKVGRPVGSGVKGHVALLVRVRPDQRDALLAMAEERREVGKPPPISEVARELLDQALKKGGRLS